MVLREKIKTIIFNSGGFPGLSRSEFLDEMRKVLSAELTQDERALLNKNQIRVESLILEITAEIADEIL